MSGLLQSEQHPDADQLNAFVEHALPEHDHRETLAHLAICADCRAVVVLAMPTLEETLPRLESGWRPWFSGWKLVWPITAAATLAIFVAATIHMRNVSIVPSVPAAPQMASDRTPPAPAPAPSQIPHAAESTQPKAVRSARQTESAPVTEKPAKSLTLPDLAPQGRAFAAPPPMPRAASSTPDFAVGAATAPLAQSLPQAASAFSSAPYKAPPVVAAAADGTTIDGIVTLPLSGRDVIGPDLALAVLRSHPLPSGLPALSIVTNTRRNQTLAVDIHGSLFLTADSGEHWVPVATPWAGRAVKVDLANPGSRHVAGFIGLSAMKQSSQLAPSAGSIGGPASISSEVGVSSLSGTITDTSGAAIPGATVIVSASPTQLARMAQTDAAGHYVVASLVPGTYTVEASYSGFTRQQLAQVAVTPGRPSTANLTLSVAATAQTVEVTAASAQIEIDDPQARIKTRAPATAAQPPLPAFEITTDTGELWVSADGLLWTRK